MTITEQKKFLRKEAKAIISRLGNTAAASATITDNILKLPEYLNAKAVFIYLSTPSEPSTDMVIAHALGCGKRVFVPRCRVNAPGLMDVIEYKADTRLTSGTYGIREPAPEYPAVQAEIDCMIIPCLAAGEDMTRLGHGGGYYDRFLQNNHGFTIMPCFDELVFSSVPTDSFDISPNMIITQTRTLKERM